MIGSEWCWFLPSIYLSIASIFGYRRSFVDFSEHFWEVCRRWFGSWNSLDTSVFFHRSSPILFERSSLGSRERAAYWQIGYESLRYCQGSWWNRWRSSSSWWSLGHLDIFPQAIRRLRHLFARCPETHQPFGHLEILFGFHDSCWFRQICRSYHECAIWFCPLYDTWLTSQKFRCRFGHTSWLHRSKDSSWPTRIWISERYPAERAAAWRLWLRFWLLYWWMHCSKSQWGLQERTMEAAFSRTDQFCDFCFEAPYSCSNTKELPRRWSLGTDHKANHPNAQTLTILMLQACAISFVFRFVYKLFQRATLLNQ